MSGYLLHGTNKPYGVGMRVSHGCIRLYPEDIKSLFPRVPVGTPVRIIDEPYKIGWLGGRLYVEAHRPLSESLTDEDPDLTHLRETILAQTKQRNREPDWETFGAAILAPTGIPVPMTLSSSSVIHLFPYPAAGYTFGSAFPDR
jgi:L,D-transpeptidase ErfK/SrfK